MLSPYFRAEEYSRHILCLKRRQTCYITQRTHKREAEETETTQEQSAKVAMQ